MTGKERQIALQVYEIALLYTCPHCQQRRGKPCLSEGEVSGLHRARVDRALVGEHNLREALVTRLRPHLKAKEKEAQNE